VLKRGNDLNLYRNNPGKRRALTGRRDWIKRKRMPEVQWNETRSTPSRRRKNFALVGNRKNEGKIGERRRLKSKGIGGVYD